MKTRYLTLVLVLYATTVVAQIPPPPAAELAKFDVTLGNWKGSGSTFLAADAPATAWTSDITYSKILDGYAIQEDVRVDVTGVGILIFRSIYAWDSHAKRFVGFSINNMGTADYGNVYWTDTATITGSQTRIEAGSVVTDRWVNEYQQDSFTFHVDRSTSGGRFFRMVKGSYERGGEVFDASQAKESLPVAPAPEQLKQLSSQLGRWSLSAEFSPFPDTPLQPVSGQNEVKSILGGHAHFSFMQGDDAPPKAYRGHNYLIWDAAANEYKSFAVDNFGGVGMETAYLQEDNQLVFTSALVLWGMPQAGRTIVEWDEDTGDTFMKSHRLAAAHAPDIAFQGTMTRIKE